MSTNAITIVSTLAFIIIISFMSSCTYTVYTGNKMYYQAMHECIEHNGTFIPTRGENNSALCLMK